MEAHALMVTRKEFAAGRGPEIARVLGENLRRFVPGNALTETAVFFADTQHLALIVGTHERQVDVDRALGWGLAWAGDRELWLAVPRESVWPTLRRAALLDTTVRVFAHDDTTVVEELLVPDRATALAAYSDALVLHVHDLGSKATWVSDLVAWADTHPHLRTAHRPSYRSWHCLGRMVLKIARRHGGLRVSAGVHAGVPSEHYVPTVMIELDGPITTAERLMIQDRAGAAIQARLTGVDSGHAEHFLQARLGDHPEVLGLVAESVRREFPCVRPGGDRAYIDLLGVDPAGTIHIVETKIGSDVMLAVQGLDYWAWAEAHRAALTAELATSVNAPIRVDFVVARPAGKALALGPYTAPQTEVLPWDMKWRFGVVDGWRLGEEPLAVSFAGWGAVASDAAAKPVSPPRYRHRLHAHLKSHFAGQLKGPSMTVGDAAHILPEARPAWDALGAGQLFHKWAHHVGSSQAFAVNLFAPLSPEAVADLLGSVFGTVVVAADPPTFEYSDPHDELRESASPHGHLTQVDVLLTGRTADGPVAVLVEVKLAETDFGWCSAATSVKNDRPDVCVQAGPFGDDPAGCFQLRNFAGPVRRRYDEFVEPGSELSAPGCWFRRSASQPMRNVALSEVLRRRHGGRVAVALCAPVAHRAMWTRWDAIRPAFNEDALVDLPAEHVLAHHPATTATRLRAIYNLGVAQDRRVVADLEWQTWSILASLVERYQTPPIVAELHPGGGMYNCVSLAADRDWHGPVVDLNRGGGMHTHYDHGLTTVRDGWRRAARWGCDEVADEIARAAGYPTRPQPVASALRPFADEVAAHLRSGRHVHWLNGMLDTSGYGTGVRAKLFEAFPELTTPRDPGDDGLESEVNSHWFLVDQDEQPLTHRYLEHSSPLALTP